MLEGPQPVAAGEVHEVVHELDLNRVAGGWTDEDPECDEDRPPDRGLRPHVLESPPAPQALPLCRSEDADEEERGLTIQRAEREEQEVQRTSPLDERHEARGPQQDAREVVGPVEVE